MKVQAVQQTAIMPMFVKTNDTDDTYVNVNDIAFIHKIKDDYWIAEGINKDAIYSFSNKSASHIINYEA